MQVVEGAIPFALFLGSRAAALADVRDESALVAVAPSPTLLCVHQLSKTGPSYTVRLLVFV